jgi:phosphate uptake regulator
MEERIEKIEVDQNIIKYKLELLEQFFKSDAEKTEAMSIFSKSINEFTLDTDERIKDLQDTFVMQSKTIGVMNQIIESQGRMIKSIVEMISEK